MGIAKKRRYCPDDDRMVLAEKQTPNHILHLLLSVVTVGFWIPVWLLVAIGSDLGTYRCPVCGGKTRGSAPRGWRPRRRRYEEDEYDDED